MYLKALGSAYTTSNRKSTNSTPPYNDNIALATRAVEAQTVAPPYEGTCSSNWQLGPHPF